DPEAVAARERLTRVLANLPADALPPVQGSGTDTHAKSPDVPARLALFSITLRVPVLRIGVAGVRLRTPVCDVPGSEDGPQPPIVGTTEKREPCECNDYCEIVGFWVPQVVFNLCRTGLHGFRRRNACHP